MSERSPASAAKLGSGSAFSMLQRKCACGGKASQVSGDCSDCQRKKALGIQKKVAVGTTDDPLEHEADRAAERVLSMPVSAAAPHAHALTPVHAHPPSESTPAPVAQAASPTAIAASGQPAAMTGEPQSQTPSEESSTTADRRWSRVCAAFSSNATGAISPRCAFTSASRRSPGKRSADRACIHLWQSHLARPRTASTRGLPARARAGARDSAAAAAVAALGKAQ